MKPNLETLQDTFRYGYQTFYESRAENEVIMDMYHNRQYTREQELAFERTGQPAETFNVVKMFTRMLLGYYSTISNTIRVTGRQQQDVPVAGILTDLVNYIFEDSHMETEGDKIKRDGLLTGLMAVYLQVQDTGNKDRFGRPIREVKLEHVPSTELVIDPLSNLEDYSDARFIHRFKWVSEEQLKKLFPTKGKKINELTAYDNHLEILESQFDYKYGYEFNGIYKKEDMYLIVHSIIEEEEGGKRWSIYWSRDTILDKKEITFNDVKFPYRIHKMETSNRAEYYGVFREVLETQRAINQALVKIQLMANTQKAFVEQDAIDDIAKFATRFNRVNAVIPVRRLDGIRVEHLSREVKDQYDIIHNALERIQGVLGITDSFLGTPYASDSGRKVKLNQNQTEARLRQITQRVNQFYRLLGQDVCYLIKQYYIAEQVIAISDEDRGQKWLQLNLPLMQPVIDPETGEPVVNPETGEIAQQPVFDYMYDPDTGEPMKDEEGNLIIAPMYEMGTAVSYADVDIRFDSVAYNDHDERNQLLMETFLQGQTGQMLANVNPPAFLQLSALSLKGMKTEYSRQMYDLVSQTAMMLGASMQQGGPAPPQLGASGSPKSSELQVPQGG